MSSRAARRTAAPDQLRRARRRPGSGDRRSRSKWREHGIAVLSVSRRRRGPGAGSALLSPRRAARAVLGCGGGRIGLGDREPGRGLPDQPLLPGDPQLRRGSGPCRARAPRRARARLRRAEPLLRRAGRLAGLAAAARRGGRGPRRSGGPAFRGDLLAGAGPLLPLDEPTRAWAADKHGLD